MRLVLVLILGALSCGQQFPTNSKEMELSLGVILTGSGPLRPSTATCATGGSCIIFQTTPGGSGALGGISGADNRCNTDSGRPNSSQYKALIVDETPLRRATLTANVGDGQLDWPLRGNRDYHRPDGTLLFRANSANLAPFPLTQFMALVAGSVWTGMFANWTTGTALSCTNWTVTGGNGNRGNPAGALTSTAIYTGFGACNNTYFLLCVEQ